MQTANRAFLFQKSGSVILADDFLFPVAGFFKVMVDILHRVISRKTGRADPVAQTDTFLQTFDRKELQGVRTNLLTHLFHRIFRGRPGMVHRPVSDSETLRQRP